MNWLKRLLGGAAETQNGKYAEKASYAEADNMGTRHDSSQKAIAYWMGERMQRQRKDPFVMYEFKSNSNARDALLALPCIKKASDTGNLICTEPLTFGCYQTDEKHWEAVILGADLSHELWSLARETFKNNGGTIKNELEPDKKSKALQRLIGEIKFVGKETKNIRGGQCTYEVYKAPNAVTAQNFLKGKAVSQRQYYIVVETPEGNYGRDIDGIYKE